MTDDDDDDYVAQQQSPSNNNNNHWQDLLRRMLPAGAPFPDEDQLDFSISVQYQQPPTHSYPIPKFLKNSSTFTKPTKNTKKFTTTNFTNSLIIPHQVSDDDVSFHTEQVSDDVSFDTTEQEDDKKNTDLSSTNVTVSETNEIKKPEHKNKNKKICNNVVSFDTSQEEEETDDDNRDKKYPEFTDEIKKQNHTNTNKNKKKVCSRCGKGKGLLRERKESCIVCDAKYCSNCLIKSMGSMPEGRKCVGCIGQPIRESRRGRLGKCSRMLSKVCSPLEVRQIMMAEKECAANRIRGEQVVVNGVKLENEDLCDLLGCSVPPVKLKPGRYWYDKDSGLWGQEGEKPDRIISSKLNVGGKLQVDASNGNTQVYINGRQITKIELRFLKLAKVQCPQGTHFWVYDDGSYEEEGQNNIKGNIWGKASTRLICSLFCLPVPSEHSRDEGSALLSRSMPHNLEHGRVEKLMLFGLEGSGTSTIFKQVRFLYGDKFTPDELQNLKLMIQSNMYRYVSVLLEGRERFEDEENTSFSGNKDSVQGDSNFDRSTRSCIYSLNTKFKHFSDWLLDILTMGDFDNYFPAATREYAPLVDEIWKDPAIQETYKRRDELHHLPDVAKYFLDQAIELSSNDYEPTEKDILYAEGVTPSNGLSYLDFSFNDRSPMSEIHDENGPSPLVKYQLIRMSTKGKPYDACKWLDMFEDARVVVFCVALSDYDQTWAHVSNGITENKMLANRDSFASLARQPCFADTPFVLILNKYDIFEEKIVRTPLSVCEWFSGFGPLKAQHNQQSLANQAYYYVAMKFKELYGSISGRKLFVCQSVGRESGSVEEALKYIREVIRWDEEREEDVYGINVNEDDDSFYNTQFDCR